MKQQGLDMAAAAAVQGALRVSQQVWATQEVRDGQAWVVPAPSAELLAQYLNHVDASWSLEWKLEHLEPPVVRAAMTIHGVRREGLAQGKTLQDAKLLALADAVVAFGLPAAEGQWVAYDPEDGADTALLEAEAQAQAQAAAPEVTLPPEAPKDPQMEKAKAHIDSLIEQIREAGMGSDITQIVIRGYGNSLEESREIYKELHAVLRGGGETQS